MARRPTTEPTPSVARGAALVAVAVLAGVFLLRNGIDTSLTVTSEREPSRPTTGTDGGTTDDGDAPDTTDTTEPVSRPPAQVLTIVLNGSGVGGAAGTYTTALSDRGYQTLPAGNASARVETTQVFFVTGYDQEAQALATSIGAPAAVVPQPMPTPPPGEVGDANVVVVLGPDLASATPPPPGEGTAPVEGDGTGDTGDTGDDTDSE